VNGKKLVAYSAPAAARKLSGYLTGYALTVHARISREMSKSRLIERRSNITERNYPREL